ncbi:MAG TPA: hypothetical protein VF797_04150, partial [Noviherbaspirillum sp.]
LAVDSAWLRHHPPSEEQYEAKRAQHFPSKRLPPAGRQVNINTLTSWKSLQSPTCCTAHHKWAIDNRYYQFNDSWRASLVGGPSFLNWIVNTDQASVP